MNKELLTSGTIVKHAKRDMLTNEQLTTTPKMYLYQIIGVARHTTTDGEVVVYRALYDDRLWVRPKRTFCGKIVLPTGLRTNRFEVYNEQVD